MAKVAMTYKNKTALGRLVEMSFAFASAKDGKVDKEMLKQVHKFDESLIKDMKHAKQGDIKLSQYPYSA